MIRFLVFLQCVATLALFAIPVVARLDQSGGLFTGGWVAGWLLAGTALTLALAWEVKQ